MMSLDDITSGMMKVLFHINNKSTVKFQSLQQLDIVLQSNSMWTKNIHKIQLHNNIKI